MIRGFGVGARKHAVPSRPGWVEVARHAVGSTEMVCVSASILGDQREGTSGWEMLRVFLAEVGGGNELVRLPEIRFAALQEETKAHKQRPQGWEWRLSSGGSEGCQSRRGWSLVFESRPDCKRRERGDGGGNG